MTRRLNKSFCSNKNPLKKACIMLHLYQSNRLEDLYGMLSHIFQLQRLPNPFAKEMVVVQSKGMGRWLNFRLAEDRGIAANIAYPLPASFFWDILNRMLGEQKRRSVFSPEVLVFRIMRWLETSLLPDQAPMLEQYLDGQGAVRRYELASRLADIFDQYLVYRPDWLAAWESGDVAKHPDGRPIFNPERDPEAQWQSTLWRTLVSEVEQEHRAQSLSQLKQMLDTGQGIERLPRRLSLVGISNLPPTYMDLLKRMARYIDVLFFAINPCAETWGDIRDIAEQERLAGEWDPSELYLDVGNPLLASWGKQGRDFFDSLAGEVELNSAFDIAENPSSLLEQLQHDILTLRNRNEDDLGIIKPQDRSVQIHVCHSPMREIEVLHDQLLNLFNQHPTLLPSEVVVLTPDIETYAPTIDAVFAPHAGTPTIPYSIADRSETQNSALAQTFLTLLGLPESRFLADAVLGLLDTEAIRRQFEIEEEDIPLLRRWVEHTRICWGRDAEHKISFGLPQTPQNAWREGLSRMIIGTALPCSMAEGEPSLYENVFPYDDIEGRRAVVAARFSCFVETLFEQAKILDEPCTLKEWSSRLEGLISVMFKAEQEDDLAVTRTLLEKLQILGELEQEAAYDKPLEVVVIRRWMTQSLESFSAGGGFLTGGVTFCTMVPMRSLPFKVICILGMNDGSFPRRKRPLGFDLMARYPRKGDRARRADDRFLFLETLLSVRHTLYISYVGKDIRTDNELPPSVLVSDLLDVITRGFVLEKDAIVIHELDGRQDARKRLLNHVQIFHPLQPFNADYFSDHSVLKGYAEDWCKAAALAGKGQKTVDEVLRGTLPLPEDSWKHLDTSELFDALMHPTRYLLKERCGFVKPHTLVNLETTEPFSLDFKSTQHLREQAWPWAIVSKDQEAAQMARATGSVPHGAWGDRLYAKEYAMIQELIALAKPRLEEPLLPRQAWQFETSEGLVLSGWLNEVRASGLLIVLPHDSYAYHLFSAWLQHLALCYARPAGAQLITTIIAEDGVHVFRSCETPEAVLKSLMDIYWSGLSQPLPLFKKSSSAFAEHMTSNTKKTPDELQKPALDKARKKWEDALIRSQDGGWETMKGELNNDVWLTRVWASIDPTDGEWQESFMHHANQVWVPLYQHLGETNI